MTLAPSQQFSHELRSLTQDAHTAAETSSFITRLLGGGLYARAYIQLLGQYQYIYAALEEVAANCAVDPAFAPLYDERLARSAALDHDLAALGAPNPPALPATVRYASRLRSLPGAEELIAHHYTRYLGDLSGGQAIGRLVGRHYGIPRSALTMWDFTSLGKIKPFKDHYREQLDMLAGRVDTERVVAEAITAFGLSRRLFAEVKSSLAS